MHENTQAVPKPPCKLAVIGSWKALAGDPCPASHCLGDLSVSHAFPFLAAHFLEETALSRDSRAWNS